MKKIMCEFCRGELIVSICISWVELRCPRCGITYILEGCKCIQKEEQK